MHNRTRDDLARAPDGSEMFLLFTDTTAPAYDTSEWSDEFTASTRRVRCAFRVLNVAWALGEIAILAWYVTTIASRYAGDAAAPSTSVTYTNPVAQPFPMISVCGYPGTATALLLRCLQYFGEESPEMPPRSCMEDVRPLTIITAGGSELSCFQLNTNASAPMLAGGVGFFHSVDMYFELNASSTAFLDALIVSYTPIGSNPTEDEVLSSTTYAQAGWSTVVTLAELSQVDVSGRANSSWSAVVSAVTNSPQLASENDISTPLTRIVYLSTSYRLLAVQAVTQQFAYPLASLFGDFAGMAGILTGLDLCSFIFGVERIVLRCRSWREHLRFTKRRVTPAASPSSLPILPLRGRRAPSAWESASAQSPV